VKVLVTGAGGFIGSHIARQVAAAGNEVIASYRSTAPKLLEGLPSIQISRIELTEPISTDVRFDAIVHAAATIGWPGVTADKMVRDNVIATRNLWRFAAEVGCSRVIYLSGVSIHGTVDQPEVTPNTPINNPGIYGLTKHLGEIMLSELVASSEEKLSGISIRLPGVLGPTASGNWLAATFGRLKKGLDVAIFNPQSPFNNAVHADDLGEFIARLIENGWQGFDAFPIGSRDPIPIVEVVHRLARGLQILPKLSIRAALQPSFTISNERARHYGYRPATIEQTLDRFVQGAT
jgi:nucleoside-diphosphate-sugar epimerase